MIDAEEYEKLKNNVLSLQAGRAVKAIMVSSSAPGEGVSTVASNFAMTLAGAGSVKILLIDGNLRRPALHRSFGVELENGLANLALGEVDIRDALRETELPNLSLITAGVFSGNAIEVLESSRLKGLIAKFREEFDYLVMDCAAINVYSDASILAGEMDGVILVVHAGATRWEVAQRAKEQLQMAEANILGVVLNRRHYYIPNFIYRRL